MERIEGLNNTTMKKNDKGLMSSMQTRKMRAINKRTARRGWCFLCCQADHGCSPGLNLGSALVPSTLVRVRSVSARIGRFTARRVRWERRRVRGVVQLRWFVVGIAGSGGVCHLVWTDDGIWIRPCSSRFDDKEESEDSDNSEPGDTSDDTWEGSTDFMVNHTLGM